MIYKLYLINRLVSQLLEIVAAQQQKINLYQSPAKPNTPSLSNRLEELPKSLLAGPKISWADQTILSEKEDDLVGGHQNMTYFLDFNSCTPLKTPSKKPTVLRQVVDETRTGLDNTTDFNTTMNAGPIRYCLPALKGIDGKPSAISEGNHLTVPETSFAQSLPLKGKLGATSEDIQLTVPVTPVAQKNSHQDYKETTPLKNISNDKSTKSNVGRPPHMRSMTEKPERKVSATHDGNTSKGLKATITRHSSFTKGTLQTKKRRMNLGAASRSVTNLHKSQKENVCPPNGPLIDSKLCRFGISKSCNVLNTAKTKGRFRF